MRTYVGHDQTWDNYLVPLEIAINSAPAGGTNMSPWYFNHGYHPRLPLDIAATTDVPAVNTFSQHFDERLRYAQACLLKAKDRQKRYADAHRRDLQFQVGQLVGLNLQHLSLPGCPSRKLSPRFSQPLRICRVVSPVAYQLELPATWKIHPVFHVSHLRPFRDPAIVDPTRATRPPPPVVTDGDAHYEVERRLRHRDHPRSGARSYLVRWHGYGVEDDSWVAARDLNAPALLREYNRRHHLTSMATGRRSSCWGHGSPINNGDGDGVSRDAQRRELATNQTTAQCRLQRRVSHARAHRHATNLHRHATNLHRHATNLHHCHATNDRPYCTANPRCTEPKKRRRKKKKNDGGMVEGLKSIVVEFYPGGICIRAPVFPRALT